MNMQHFDIAKYLKEHNLGSFGILNNYIDLQAVKEEKDLGQQEAMPEPYEGPKDPIDGLGDKMNRDMDVSMNEEGSMHDKMSQEYQAWLRKNNLPQMSADELLNDPSIKKTDAQIAYIKDFIDKWEAVNEEDMNKEAEYQHRDIDSYPESERIMDLGGQQIEQGIISLLDDGFDARDIVDLVKELLTAHISAKSQGKSF